MCSVTLCPGRVTSLAFHTPSVSKVCQFFLPNSPIGTLLMTKVTACHGLPCTHPPVVHPPCGRSGDHHDGRARSLSLHKNLPWPPLDSQETPQFPHRPARPQLTGPQRHFCPLPTGHCSSHTGQPAAPTPAWGPLCQEGPAGSRIWSPCLFKGCLGEDFLKPLLGAAPSQPAHLAHPGFLCRAPITICHTRDPEPSFKVTPQM